MSKLAAAASAGAPVLAVNVYGMLVNISTFVDMIVFQEWIPPRVHKKGNNTTDMK